MYHFDVDENIFSRRSPIPKSDGWKMQGANVVGSHGGHPSAQKSQCFPQKDTEYRFSVKKWTGVCHKLAQNMPNVEIFHQGFGSFLFITCIVFSFLSKRLHFITTIRRI
jgi:hypothetical protein